MPPFSATDRPTHAFVLNCHTDLAQAVVTTRLLRAYWPASAVYLYYDGPEPEAAAWAALGQQCTVALRGAYERDKVVSIFGAMNATMAQARADGVDVVSFLHPDMIPVYPDVFYAFVERWRRSDCWVTYVPIRPEPQAPLLDFCALHFRLDRMVAHGLFPIRICGNLADAAQHFNEMHLTMFFDTFRPHWRDEAYPLWMISTPAFNNEWYTPTGVALVHNYIPETSVVHSNDPWLWEHYADIAGFARAPYPAYLR